MSIRLTPNPDWEYAYVDDVVNYDLLPSVRKLTMPVLLAQLFDTWLALTV